MMKNYLSLAGLTMLLFCAMNPAFSQDAEIELKTKEVNSGIVIEWTLTDDITAEQFILERSVHGTRFNPIETYYDIQKTLENQSSFTFLDNQMGMDKVAYRLKFIEDDRSVFFSKTKELRKEVINTFRVANQELLPQGVFSVTLECIEKSELEFILLDGNGEKVFKEKWNVELGLNDFFINLDYFLDGSYSALIKKDKEYQTLTFNKTTRKSDEVAMKKSKWNNKH